MTIDRSQEMAMKSEVISAASELDEMDRQLVDHLQEAVMFKLPSRNTV
jgi:hypothetical protein